MRPDADGTGGLAEDGHFARVPPKAPTLACTHRRARRWSCSPTLPVDRSVFAPQRFVREEAEDVEAIVDAYDHAPEGLRDALQVVPPELLLVAQLEGPRRRSTITGSSSGEAAEAAAATSEFDSDNDSDNDDNNDDDDEEEEEEEEEEEGTCTAAEAVFLADEDAALGVGDLGTDLRRRAPSSTPFQGALANGAAKRRAPTGGSAKGTVKASPPPSVKQPRTNPPVGTSAKVKLRRWHRSHRSGGEEASSSASLREKERGSKDMQTTKMRSNRPLSKGC